MRQDPTEAEAVDALRLLGEELSAMFAEERRAIAGLDHGRITYIVEQKRHMVARLGEVLAAAPLSLAKDIRELLAAVRVEAHATALLASAATEAVRALLGYESAGYDHRAKRTTNPAPRILATY